MTATKRVIKAFDGARGRQPATRPGLPDLPLSANRRLSATSLSPCSPYGRGRR
jgi:hypothetical protein